VVVYHVAKMRYRPIVLKRCDRTRKLRSGRLENQIILFEGRIGGVRDEGKVPDYLYIQWLARSFNRSD